MSELADFTHDIQGEIIPKDQATQFEPITRDTHASVQDDPIGTGSETIPVTSPGLDYPDLPTTGLRDSGDIVDPLKSAVDANAAGLKEMGMITVSQADANNKDGSGKVLGAVPAFDG